MSTDDIVELLKAASVVDVTDVLVQAHDEIVRLRAENERLRAALTPAAMATAMQDAWNEWCSDTGCIPDGFSVAGPRTTRVYFDVTASTFPDRVVAQLLANVEEP